MNATAQQATLEREIEEQFDQLVRTNPIVKRIWQQCVVGELSEEAGMMLMVASLADQNRALTQRQADYWACGGITLCVVGNV